MEQTIPITHVKKSQFGTPKVGGVTIALLSRFIDDPEWPIERICEQYYLTPSQVYAAWSYYYDHQEEIEQAIQSGDELARQVGSPISAE